MMESRVLRESQEQLVIVAREEQWESLARRVNRDLKDKEASPVCLGQRVELVCQV